MEICIAENLRMLRRKSGYSLEAVAEIIGVSRQSVSKWELGETDPDISNCLKLATLFHVSLDDFVTQPLYLLEEQPVNAKGGQVFGMLEVLEQGTVKLPAYVLEQFGIAVGEKLLLLGDQEQGIALVKCKDLTDMVRPKQEELKWKQK